MPPFTICASIWKSKNINVEQPGDQTGQGKRVEEICNQKEKSKKKKRNVCIISEKQ